jgi:CO/xanthine dehydrogenase Mo-binding subunit
MRKFTVVGKSVPKVDALPLSLGSPLFTDDVEFRGMLTAKILWSPYAHAKIKAIETSAAEAFPGVHAVICHKNVPRVLHTTAGQMWPEPSPYDTAVFDNKVRYVGDRVAAVAAETEEIACKALELIRVEYEPLPPVLDSERAMDEGAPVIHDESDTKYLIPIFYDPTHNHCAHIDLDIGDFDQGVKAADFVVEREFKTHYAQHCTLEPHSCISYVDPYGRIVIRTSTQVPFHVRRIVAACLQIPEKMIRVIKPRIGGGFGSKQCMVIEDVCAILAMRTKRPVRLRYTREEVFVSSRTRHPMVMWAKTGVKKDGALSAISLRVLSNTGPYGAHAMTVMSNTCAKTLPLFRCDNIRFIGDTVYTNLPKAGAYRGYGVTQGTFALATMMDEMASTIGMDPVKFWKMNTIKRGETSPIFKALSETGSGIDMIVESCSLPECIDQGAKAFGWSETRERIKNQREGVMRHGVGMCCMVQGGTVPLVDMASASAKINEDGSFNLLIGAADLGTGADTVLSQIFAETLGIAVGDVVVYASDTDITPFDKGAYASGTTYVSGAAVLKTARKIKEQILDEASAILDEPKDNLLVEGKAVISRKTGKKVEFRQIAEKAIYTNTRRGRDQFQIAATASAYSHLPPQSFAAHFVEVAVDTQTGQVTVLTYVAAVDCGTVINPKLAEGQIHGAIINGIGYALTEELILDEKGRVKNPSFRDYKILSSLDIPEITTILVPSYEPTGPYGAKTLGEININGPLPAISNAIKNAVGIRLCETPFTPERVLKALKKTDAPF